MSPTSYRTALPRDIGRGEIPFCLIIIPQSIILVNTKTEKVFARFTHYSTYFRAFCYIFSCSTVCGAAYRSLSARSLSWEAHCFRVLQPPASARISAPAARFSAFYRTVSAFFRTYASPRSPLPASFPSAPAALPPPSRLSALPSAVRAHPYVFSYSCSFSAFYRTSAACFPPFRAFRKIIHSYARRYWLWNSWYYGKPYN